MLADYEYAASNYTMPLQRRYEVGTKEMRLNNDILTNISLRKERVELSDSLFDIFGFFKDKIDYYSVSKVKDDKFVTPDSDSVIDMYVMMDG